MGGRVADEGSGRGYSGGRTVSQRRIYGNAYKKCKGKKAVLGIVVV